MAMKLISSKSRLVGQALVFGALGFVVFGLSACGSVQSALGLEKSPPDEFAVVTKAPLVVPPDYSLRPPRPGAPRPQELQPAQSVKNALLGEPVEPGSEVSAGEVALLVDAGAGRVDPNIREVINEEAGRLKDKDESFTDKILFWRDGGESLPPAKVINASDESQRLKTGAPEAPAAEAPAVEATEEAAPADAELPTINKKKGILGRIRDIF